jgi:hypothetical protein
LTLLLFRRWRFRLDAVLLSAYVRVTLIGHSCTEIGSQPSAALSHRGTATLGMHCTATLDDVGAQSFKLFHVEQFDQMELHNKLADGQLHAEQLTSDGSGLPAMRSALDG